MIILEEMGSIIVIVLAVIILIPLFIIIGCILKKFTFY